MKDINVTWLSLVKTVLSNPRIKLLDGGDSVVPFLSRRLDITEFLFLLIFHNVRQIDFV